MAQIEDGDIPLRKFDSDGYEVDPKWLADLVYRRMERAEATLARIRQICTAPVGEVVDPESNFDAGKAEAFEVILEVLDAPA